ncbi:PLC-like phosphodiesterase [Xylaria sp. CBS 124048]|nr:PLC-like phosphodiesterase [Xylaria sp. CBS 124048]
MAPSLRTFAAALAAFASTAYSTPQAVGDVAPALAGTPVSVSTIQAAATPASTASAAVACNNSPDLCNQSYANITHMGAHDSSFLRDASTQNSVAGNQFFNATVALDAGLRMLQVQVHNLNDTIEMCHTLCSLLDAGPLENWLADIKVWMDENPNEVVTLLIVNSDGQDVSAFGSVFEASGIAQYGFVPSGKGWPTLQSMISANTRLVTFIASITSSSSFPYLLSEFDFVFETAFGVTSPDGFNCTIDRPSSPSTAAAALEAGLLPLINHFRDTDLGASLSLPDVSDVGTTNSPSTNISGSLGLHAATCKSEWGHMPTFVLVDFWNEGPAIDTADVMNGVTHAVGRRNDTAEVQDATAPGNGAGRGRGAAGMGTGALIAFFAAALLLV